MLPIHTRGIIVPTKRGPLCSRTTSLRATNLHRRSAARLWAGAQARAGERASMRWFVPFTVIILLAACGVAPGVPPVVLGTEPDMFPTEWLSPDINARATDLETSEFGRAMTVITAAMRKYQ